MPIAISPPRRRSRSIFGDEDDNDELRASGRSTPSATNSAKRPRTSGYARGSSIASNAGNGDENGFQPGAIVRVDLRNFITYEKAEFFPGPNLNMVIGPNGTGKSSLVCAICLGLGWGAQHLGRATQVGEFVKHGTSEAIVEIELQGRPDDDGNHVIRSKIIRDGNSREWWVNNKKSSLKAVQALTRKLNIQIDNLCQFLPQDKVSEFAALSPVDLLQQTQRAAAPEKMLQQHDQLKELRKDQKTLEVHHEADQARLQNLEGRQQNLQPEVERLKERDDVVAQIRFLEKCMPFVEYQEKLGVHRENAEVKKQAQEQLHQLRQQVAPVLEAVNSKKAYRDQISQVVKERKTMVKRVEQDADGQAKGLEKFVDQIQTNDNTFVTERKSEVSRRNEIKKLDIDIRDLQAKIDQPPPEFNAAEHNELIRAKTASVNQIKADKRELLDRLDEVRTNAKANRSERYRLDEELRNLESQAGKDLSKIAARSKDTAAAWKWIQENQALFEKEVFGPPVVTCSVKDPRYTSAIESLFKNNNYLIITTQTRKDHVLLSDKLSNLLKLSQYTLRCVTDTVEQIVQRNPLPLSPQQLKDCGLERWAIDCIDGPGPVLTMLCENLGIHKSAISAHDISPGQHDLILRSSLRTWIAGNHVFTVSGRAEYGPTAMSTKAEKIRPASVFVDGPVDTSRRRDIEERYSDLQAAFEELRNTSNECKAKEKEFKDTLYAIETELSEAKKDKDTQQKAFGQYKALPQRLERLEDTKSLKMAKSQETVEKLKKLGHDTDRIVLKKGEAIMEYKDAVLRIRACQDELLTAQIMLVEATSDVSALEEQNSGIHQQLEEETARSQEAERKSKEAKLAAKEAKKACEEVLIEDPEMNDKIGDVNKTIEELEAEKQAEENKLALYAVGNAHVIDDFNRRKDEIDKLGEKITDTEGRLGRIQDEITKIREVWEPELDKLISHISDAFAFNFEQIGCAGEVAVHKDDDFNQWAIQIKVKFRENETLQLLDSHRQSGGERSVSTIFYLMSLQSLARAPFRVVDEINQGMDPRNERMVHERMVDIACKEHTSQYFLITPKLLTGLKYDRRMKVLCIASGEFMPAGNGGRLDLERILGTRRRRLGLVRAAA